MIKLENEKLFELIIVWYNGRHSQLNLCIEVNVYSYIALNTWCSFFYLETDRKSAFECNSVNSSLL